MITQKRLKEVLYLDHSTGTFTNRLKRGNLEPGDPVGHLIEGYTYICVDSRTYPAHHLVWLWNTGEYPSRGKDMDHINRDRNDNRFENLRLCTRSENMQNTLAHKDSRSGIKNVFFRKDTRKWSVRVSVGGVYRSFGCYENKELAELVAFEVRDKYHGEFSHA